MADDTRQLLRQAYELIRTKQRQEAEQILQPIVQANPDNKDAWWLLANAVTDPLLAREALQNVLRLQPDHDKAAAMLEKINARYPPPAPEPEPAAADPFDFGAADDDPFAAMAASSPAAPAADPFGAPQSFGTPRQPSSQAVDPFGPAQSFGAPTTARPAPSDDPFGGPVGSPASAARVPRSSGGMSSGTRTLLIVLAVVGVIAICGCVACWGLAQAGIASIGIFGSSVEEVFGTIEAVATTGGFTSNTDSLGDSLSPGYLSRGALSYGDVRQDSLSQGNERHAWTFTGSAGDNITIAMQEINNSDVDTLIELYGPNNVMIARDDDGGDGFNSLLNFVLPSDGTYTIIARSWSSFDTGQYEIRLSR